MNPEKPFISVILPVYNRAFMLDKVLDSLTHQTRGIGLEEKASLIILFHR